MGPSPPSLGLDLARLGAIALIAWQHAMSLGGLEPPAFFGVLNVGQLGVAVFCCLSGFLALQTPRQGGDRAWIRRRLARVLVPYWIALTAILTANAVTAYKAMSPGLVVSEYLGIAHFTHPGRMIGVHTWLLSLILSCYGMAVILRWRPRLLGVLAAASSALVLANPLFAAHMLSFLVGSSQRLFPPRRHVAAYLLGLCCCVLAVRAGIRVLAFPAAAGLLLSLARLVPGTSSRAVRTASDLTYEFFLVHGPVYLALTRYLGIGFPGNLLWGTVPAIGATLLLRTVSSRITSWCSSGRIPVPSLASRQ